MPSTIATIPALAVPKLPAKVIVTPADGSCNFIRIWCTVAPAGSELDGKIKELRQQSTASRLLVFSGPPGSSHAWRPTLDKGGAYTLILQSYAKGNTWGGGYFGDPRGAPTETKLGGEETLTLYIGERLEHEVGTGPDTATLVTWSWNDTIRRTLSAVHGETTPAIINPSSDKARTAAADNGVDLTVRDLANENFLGMLGVSAQLGLLQNLQQTFDAHLADAVHNATDTNNQITAELVASTSPDRLPEALNIAYQKIRGHLLNDASGSGSPPAYGPGTADYHRISSQDRIDYKNAPLVGSCTPETSVAMLADLVRAVEFHMEDATFHSSPDLSVPDINQGGAASLVHYAFFTALAKAEQTPAPGQGSLASKLAAYGFRTG
jgi:hypothetical protein